MQLRDTLRGGLLILMLSASPAWCPPQPQGYEALPFATNVEDRRDEARKGDRLDR
jgi:hypothetical protein